MTAGDKPCKERKGLGNFTGFPLVLLAALGVLLFTSIGGLHEDSHADDAGSHGTCLVCSIFSGLVDPMSPAPFWNAVLKKSGETVTGVGDHPFPAVFWKVVSTRAPPRLG